VSLQTVKIFEIFDTCSDVQPGIHRVFISVSPTEVLWGFADVVESHRTSVGQSSYKNQKYNY
jgi:hypothetical protein